MLLKDMETVVEDYYNSGLFSHQIGWMLDQEQSVFSFFLNFGKWKVANGLRLIPQSFEDRCTTLKTTIFPAIRTEHPSFHCCTTCACLTCVCTPNRKNCLIGYPPSKILYIRIRFAIFTAMNP